MRIHNRIARRALGIFGTAALAVTTALGAPAAIAEETPPADHNNGGLNQVIDPNQQQATDQVVLDAGHIDFGPTLNTGEWAVQIHDDTTVPRYWRMPADVAIQVNDDSKLTVPDDDNYAFMGEAAGTEVYVVPQTQKENVIWTGWNTQEPNVLEQVDMGVTMSMTGFEGPGSLNVFLQSGNFGAPDLLYTTNEAMPQSTWIELNTHTHANWVFSKPGIYLVELEFSADLRDGTKVTARDTLRFAVGNETDPQAAFDATPLSDGSADAAGSQAGTGAGADAVGQDAAAGDSSRAAESGVPGYVWIIAAALGAVLLIAVVVMASANARMKKRVRAARAAKAAQGGGVGTAVDAAETDAADAEPASAAERATDVTSADVTSADATSADETEEGK
ncbi:TIGR03773 family transporter-associated surface protein [Gulosibacter bifidus]|uniref:TIGR03773 family transporter-associated surface protein n=1 Tax=Gulosibacter bifidus TaxID=272239 RepID=A0ABW5RKP2_9MICO|nr:TIGR03773 family transporter-associated surface protein [Gulosibacter bifidus]